MRSDRDREKELRDAQWASTQMALMWLGFVVLLLALIFGGN